ncbi:ATPase-like protein [Pseudomassariella vexata]|uniref:ATPase-like protein n=1 Tax=Pseudomassariella vexata TaxID=1141098 RepID=A0A1Y2E9D6_9PEZI|nr:ATPase-like protein [Pseudomassariella vexata]ORY68183.1 ATPase-like protein [Pseudomassariella vexata]
MDFSRCSTDDTIGPSVRGCRDDFDFTLRFEKIFLSLIPASVFIAAALPRIVCLARCPRIVGGTILQWLKLAAITVYTALQLILLIYSTKLYSLRALFVSSAAVNLVSAFCILVLSYLEHSRSPRSSILLSAFLILTALFDVAQTRSLWLASVGSSDLTFTRLVTSSGVLKFVLVLLESLHKSRWVQWDAKVHSPEEASGLLGLGAFTWLNRLFLVGYRKVISIEDLFPLDQTMATESLQLKLMDQVGSCASKGQKRGLELAKVLGKTLAVPLLLPIGPRVALLGFKFCQPFLIDSLLNYMQQPAERPSTNVGYGLIGATILIYGGIAISTSFYWYLHERSLCMSRGCLAGAVYKKTTEAKLSASGDAAAITLMSTDVERIRLGFLNLHEFWANTIEVGLASWLLQRQLGTAFVAPLIVVIVCVLGGAYTNKFTGRRQKVWMDKIQRRVGTTANVISNMKHLKISGLAGPVRDLIQNMRVDELKSASKFRIIYVTVIIFGYIPMALCPVVTFAVTSRTLDITTIFTSLSFLLLLADPLGYLFQNTPNLLAAFACLERIQNFLEAEPRVDIRQSRRIDQKSDSGEGSGADDREDKSGSAIMVSHGQFGWAPDKMGLRDICLEIPAARLTIVVGPVASGKSTLCKALLGEVPVSLGHVYVNSDVISSRIGYCDQTPYLSNASIRENIIGFSQFDQARYREVIEATVLEPDLSILPQGDLTNVGSNGVTLSGGQRQRVSMARALYLDTNFYIFDDILSGLDADTEDQVFRRIFSPSGIIRRRGATAILCTHSIRYLPSADNVVALGSDGSIVEQGNFSHLLANKSYIHGLGINPNDEVDPEDKISVTEPQDRLETELVTVPTTQSIVPSHVGEQERMMGDPTVYRYYLSTLGKRSFVAFIVFGLGWGFFYNWGNVWLKFWSEDVSSAYPNHSNSFYIGLYALFQMIYLLSMFFVFLICFTTMIQISGSKLHLGALTTVINAPLRFFNTTDTGLVTNLFSQDMTLIDHELPIAVTNLALDICNALGMAAVIASSSPYLAITYPVLFAVLYGIQKFYLRTSRQLRLLDLEAKSPLYTHFLDTIRGIATFRAFGWVQDGIKLNNQLLDTSQRPTYLLAVVQRWLLFALQTVVAILAVTVVAMATQLRSSTALTGAGLITLMTFGDILNYIIRWLTQIETSIGAVSRLKNLGEKVRPETLDGEDVVPPCEWPFRGAIRIDGVSASYNPVEGPEDGSADSDAHPMNMALKDMRFSIKSGEKVAICGRSGSGKSSTILLLLRLLDPLADCSENIVIDGLPLHKIDRTILRQRIIAVPQDAVFLPEGTSVMANLDPCNASTESECQGVLEVVGLWTLFSHRGGINEGLSAGTLSQGQKQLFSLARAILRRRIRAREYANMFGTASEKKSAGILLLDEVSSSVDQDTDRAMQRIIKEEFDSYTIVMVSHRLEMVMDFDNVIVMDKGSVVEQGAPKTLVEQEGSWFRELWRVGNRS